MTAKPVITVEIELLEEVIAEAVRLDFSPAATKLAKILEDFEAAKEKADPREEFSITTVGALRKAIQYMDDHESVLAQLIVQDDNKTALMLPIIMQRAYQGSAMVIDVTHPSVVSVVLKPRDLSLRENTKAHLQGGVPQAELAATRAEHPAIESPAPEQDAIELDDEGKPAKIAVTRKALLGVLKALLGPGHLIRELQAIMHLPAGAGYTNPINVLVDEYEKFEIALNPESVLPPQQER